MDKEKVIKELENLRETIRNATQYTFTSGGVCAMNMKRIDNAIELLKEQEEPKQIVRKQCKKEWEDGSIDYFAEWYCPHCDMLILRGFDNPSIKFCFKCGKPIMWESR